MNRSMSRERHLSLLDERKKELETCGYCPKLCRAACPVSNAEPRDTLTPWGKMSLSWFAARGDVPADAAHASVAWACTGCHNCRENCDHRNPVADTLADARGDFFAAGVAPEAVVRSAARQAERNAELTLGIQALGDVPGVDPRSPTALLVGCTYVRSLPDEARDAVTAVAELAGNVRLVDGCCGLPLLAAGDRAGFAEERRRLESSLDGARGADRRRPRLRDDAAGTQADVAGRSRRSPAWAPRASAVCRPVRCVGTTRASSVEA